jgi:diamine N-acetyltransferase
MRVTLQPITADTVRQITDLAVSPEHQSYVASNAVSLAQALFHPEAWYRAVYVDDAPAGFVMLYDETIRPEPPPEPKVYLWRFMVDRRFQRRGIGQAALEELVAHLRGKGAFRTLRTSYVPGPDSPAGFYLRFGFNATGEIDDGEHVLELSLVPKAG